MGIAPNGGQGLHRRAWSVTGAGAGHCRSSWWRGGPGGRHDRRLRFSTGRFPPAPAACYRASWQQLPGPDLHRLADTSLRVNHLNVTISWSSLCTHAAGHTKTGL